MAEFTEHNVTVVTFMQRASNQLIGVPQLHRILAPDKPISSSGYL